MMPCKLVNSTGTWEIPAPILSVKIKQIGPEDGSSNFLRNAECHLRINTVSIQKI